MRCCPKCGAEPFTYFMRGNVVRGLFDHPVLMRWARRWGWNVCAVICGDCKDIVGWEKAQ